MQFTNKLGLPEPIALAISNREYSRGESDISVTGLLNPPQLHRLLRLYAKDIVVDVSESIWALFGTAVHHILSSSGSENAIQEERFYMPVGDWVVSGQTDTYNKLTKKISDYKVTSIYKVQKGDFDDWTFQLNAYKLLMEHNKYEVNELEIIAIIRDWSHSDARNPKNTDYPKAQVLRIPIKIMKPIEILIEIAKRIKALQEVQNNSREDLPPCTPKERWAQSDSWLVYNPEKNYTYRRIPVETSTEIPSLEVASQMAKIQAESIIAGMSTGANYIAKFDPGFSLRCEYFCPVKEFCFQRSKNTPQAIVDTTPLSTEDIQKALGS